MDQQHDSLRAGYPAVSSQASVQTLEGKIAAVEERLERLKAMGAPSTHNTHPTSLLASLTTSARLPVPPPNPQIPPSRQLPDVVPGVAEQISVARQQSWLPASVATPSNLFPAPSPSTAQQPPSAYYPQTETRKPRDANTGVVQPTSVVRQQSGLPASVLKRIQAGGSAAAAAFQGKLALSTHSSVVSSTYEPIPPLRLHPEVDLSSREAVRRLHERLNMPSLPFTEDRVWEAEKNRALLLLSSQVEELKSKGKHVLPIVQQDPAGNDTHVEDQSWRPESLQDPLIAMGLQPHKGSGVPDTRASAAAKGSEGLGSAQAPPKLNTGPPNPLQWEYQKNSAILAMERQVVLLTEKAAGVTAIQEAHKRKLLQLEKEHTDKIKKAEGEAGVKLRSLTRRTWRTMQLKQWAVQGARMVRAWSWYAARERRLRRASNAWRLRVLGSCLVEWRTVTIMLKRGKAAAKAAAQKLLLRALDAWSATTAYLLHCKYILTRAAKAKLAGVVWAWHAVALRLAAKREAFVRADRFAEKQLMRLACRGFTAAVENIRRLGVLATVHRTFSVFKAWRAAASWKVLIRNKARRGCLRTQLAAWRRYTVRSSALQRLIAHMLAVQRERKLRIMLRAWWSVACMLRDLKRKGKQLAEMHRSWVQHGSIRAFIFNAKLMVAAREFHRRCALRIMTAWHAAAVRISWCRKVSHAAVASRRRAMLHAAWAGWRRAQARLLLRDMKADLVVAQNESKECQRQAHLSSLHAEVCNKKAAATISENEALRAEVARKLAIAGNEASLLAPTLSWRSLPADPDQYIPSTRFHHATFALEGLQKQELLATFPDAPLGPGLGTALVTYGGVSGDLWYADTHVLELWQDGEQAFSYNWLPCDSQRQGQAPAPRRDFAASTAGPVQFMIMGGFDGAIELADVHVCTVKIDEESTSSGRYIISWEAPAIRNRLPLGRCHHTLSFHQASRSAYVFGGYASRSGCLNELWALHVDQWEWWQPETLGSNPPPRRSHVAAMVGNRLYVHGGFNGWENLDDFWVLDLSTWQWLQIESQGAAPSPRRGHACEVVADRYFVLFGGYDGSAHFNDIHIYDTVANMWSRIDVDGSPDDAPVPCNLSTLTQSCHGLVLWGGCGARGPVGGIHVLQNSGLVEGQLQSQRLVSNAEELRMVRTVLADVEGERDVANATVAQTQHELETFKASSAALVAEHNEVVEALRRARKKVQDTADRLRVVEVEAREAKARVANLERKLSRAREGGAEVVAAAEDLHVQLQDAKDQADWYGLQVAALQESLSHAEARLLAAAEEAALLRAAATTAAEEAARARSMVETTERECKAAMERNRDLVEEEMRVAKSIMQEAHKLEQEMLARLREEEDGYSEDFEDVDTQDGDQSSDRAQTAIAPPSQPLWIARKGRKRGHDKLFKALDGTAVAVSPMQLASVYARAQAADARVEELYRQLGELKGEMSARDREVRGARDAEQRAREDAALALRHLNERESHYKQEVLDLQQQVKALTSALRQRELESGPARDIMIRDERRMQGMRNDTVNLSRSTQVTGTGLASPGHTRSGSTHTQITQAAPSTEPSFNPDLRSDYVSMSSPGSSLTGAQSDYVAPVGRSRFVSPNVGRHSVIGGHESDGAPADSNFWFSQRNTWHGGTSGTTPAAVVSTSESFPPGPSRLGTSAAAQSLMPTTSLDSGTSPREVLRQSLRRSVVEQIKQFQPESDSEGSSSPSSPLHPTGLPSAPARPPAVADSFDFSKGRVNVDRTSDNRGSASFSPGYSAHMQQIGARTANTSILQSEDGTQAQYRAASGMGLSQSSVAGAASQRESSAYSAPFTGGGELQARYHSTSGGGARESSTAGGASQREGVAANTPYTGGGPQARYHSASGVSAGDRAAAAPGSQREAASGRDPQPLAMSHSFSSTQQGSSSLQAIPEAASVHGSPSRGQMPSHSGEEVAEMVQAYGYTREDFLEGATGERADFTVQFNPTADLIPTSLDSLPEVAKLLNLHRQLLDGR